MGSINQLFPSTLGATKYCRFYDPANTGNSVTINVNPSKYVRNPSTLRKFTLTTNRTSVILGDAEAPPKELAVSWDMLDYTQIQALSAFTNISPIVFVGNDNNAYLGVLCFDQLEQLNAFTRNVWSLKASFLVLGPYDPDGSSINKLTAPTITATLSGSTGYIANPSSIYIAATVFSPFGESVLGTVTTISNITSSAAYSLSWTPPSSLYFTKLRLYWFTSNTPTSMTLLADILSGFPQDVPNTFTVFSNYVQYSTITAPTYSTSYSGYFAGGLWQQTS